MALPNPGCSPEPMLGIGTHGRAAAGTSWRLNVLERSHFPYSITDLQPCCLFLLSSVILTDQWSNYFLLYLPVSCGFTAFQTHIIKFANDCKLFWREKLSDFTQCWPDDNANIALSEYLLEHIKILLLDLISCCVLVTTATGFMNKINSFDILSQFLR